MQSARPLLALEVPGRPWVGPEESTGAGESLSRPGGLCLRGRGQWSSRRWKGEVVRSEMDTSEMDTSEMDTRREEGQVRGEWGRKTEVCGQCGPASPNTGPGGHDRVVGDPGQDAED